MASSHNTDLYDDLYGDDDNEFAVPLQKSDQEDETERPSEDPTSEPLAKSPHSKQASSPPKQETHPSSLPAKPPSPNSGALSYSAQIARQFSSYQQTPSQERQQRAEIPLPPHPKGTVSGSSSISESVFGKKPSEMHDTGKLFIGGLNWDTTDEGLRNYFSEFGKVDACTIMRDSAGASRGFAFLTFEDPTSVNAVVVREHYLDGKLIDPKRAIPREEHLRNTRYFVGGLSPITTSETMRQFFLSYGKVVDATVMIDKESNRSKGFGFVTFEDASNADQLVGKAGLILDDKQIEVKMAQPRNQRDQMRTPTVTKDYMFNDQEIQPSLNIPFMTPQQVNPMLYQRPMNQVPMMGGVMPMMNINPMAMMGMGMNGYHQMGLGNGLNMMGGMNASTGLNLHGFGGVGGAMRLGMMGPIGGRVEPGVNLGNMMPGMATDNKFGRLMNNLGPGPLRMNNRGQHNFHPYLGSR